MSHMLNDPRPQNAFNFLETHLESACTTPPVYNAEYRVSGALDFLFIGQPMPAWLKLPTETHTKDTQGPN